MFQNPVCTAYCSLHLASARSRYFEADLLADGVAHVHTCKEPVRKQSVRKAEGGAGDDLDEDRVFDIVRNYVPGAVIPFLNKAEEKWASELRRVSVIFVNLGMQEADLLAISTPRGLKRCNDVMRAVQTAFDRFEGSINKFLMDDKGSTLIAVFGLPPLAHEDDSTRAILRYVL